MDYQHLTTFERGRIEALHNLGYTAVVKRFCNTAA
jgi:IS30 family transposase